MAEIGFEMDEAEIVYQALAPEMGDALHKGVVQLETCDDEIVLRVWGDDVGSMRAALNTWIRLIKIGWEMVNI